LVLLFIGSFLLLLLGHFFMQRVRFMVARLFFGVGPDLGWEDRVESDIFMLEPISQVNAKRPPLSEESEGARPPQTFHHDDAEVQWGEYWVGLGVVGFIPAVPDDPSRELAFDLLVQ